MYISIDRNLTINEYFMIILISMIMIINKIIMRQICYRDFKQTKIKIKILFQSFYN